jgi:hypothetical protein
MNINPDLIEKITRLVLAKLNESVEPLPLTDEEIKRWNEISCLFQAFNAVSTTIVESSQLARLSEEELRQWEQISASFSATNDKPQVKFHQTYN